MLHESQPCHSVFLRFMSLLIADVVMWAASSFAEYHLPQSLINLTISHEGSTWNYLFWHNIQTREGEGKYWWGHSTSSLSLHTSPWGWGLYIHYIKLYCLSLGYFSLLSLAFSIQYLYSFAIFTGAGATCTPSGASFTCTNQGLTSIPASTIQASPGLQAMWVGRAWMFSTCTHHCCFQLLYFLKGLYCCILLIIYKYISISCTPLRHCLHLSVFPSNLITPFHSLWRLNSSILHFIINI